MYWMGWISFIQEQDYGLSRPLWQTSGEIGRSIRPNYRTTSMTKRLSGFFTSAKAALH